MRIEDNSTTQNATVYNQVVYKVASWGTFCFFAIKMMLNADQYGRDDVYDVDAAYEVYFWVSGSFAMAGTVAFIAYFFLRNKLILFGRIGFIFASALTLLIHNFRYGIESLRDDDTESYYKKWIWADFIIEALAWLFISTIDFILTNNSQMSRTLGLMKIAGFWIFIGISRILHGEKDVNYPYIDYIDYIDDCEHSYATRGYLDVFSGVFYIIAGLMFLIVTWAKFTPKAYFGAIFSTFTGVLLYTIAFNLHWSCRNDYYIELEKSYPDGDFDWTFEVNNKDRAIKFMQSCAFICAAILYFPTLKTVESGTDMITMGETAR